MKRILLIAMIGVLLILSACYASSSGDNEEDVEEPVATKSIDLNLS